MAGKRKQRCCRICRKRPPWHYKNCPPGICKRCYHKHVWTERPAAHRDRPTTIDPSPTPESGYGHPADYLSLDDLSDWFE
jgi:hypothetical protein